ncbi:MAG: hypothetical protein WBB39_03535 [Candidatus Saccharimonadales bacterium]
MKPTADAVRAITGVYFQRVLVIVISSAICVLVIVYLLLGYLATSLTPWWWIFLVILVPITLVATALSAILWFASSRLLPRRLDRTEKKFVYRFGQKLVAVIGQERLPYPIMMVFIVRSIVKGKGSELFKKALDDTPSLRQDFQRIRRMFD